MAAVVQTKAATGANSVTFDSATTTGNKIVVTVWVYAGSTFVNGDITDNKGNTYTVRPQNTSVAAKTAIFESQDSPTMGAGHVVSVNSSQGLDRGLCAHEVSGLTTSPFDTSANTAAGAQSNLTVGPTATLAQSDEVAFAVMCIDTGGSITITPAVGESWTQAGEEENGSSFLVYSSLYKVVAATTALSATWTTGAFTDASGCVATFKAAAAGNTGSPTLGSFTSTASGTVTNPPQVSYVKEVGAVTNATAATTAAMTVAAGGVPTGDLVVVLGSADNTGSSGVATTVTVTDTRSNTWTTLTPQAIADPGAAAAGVQGFMAWTRVTTAMQAGDTITVTFGNSTTAKAINAQQLSNVDASSPILAGSYATQDNQTGTTSSVSATATRAGQAVLALVAVEGGTADAFTQDSDTTNGSWVGLTRRGSGTTTSGSTLNSAYKIVTASGAQTYDPTMGTARDHAAAIVVIDLPTTVTGTAAVTLNAFTSSSSGTVTAGPVTGTAAVTLGSFVSSASGTRTVPAITGTAAVTLGSFTSALSYAFPYPVAISATHNRLVDQNGNVFLGKGLSFWGGIMRVPESEVDATVTTYADLGFSWINCDFTGAVRSQTTWDPVRWKNEAGEAFYPGLPFQLGPSDQLGPAFDTVEHWVQAAADNGICMMLSIFLSYGTTGAVDAITAATNTQMERFGLLVGQRLNGYPNIVWEIESDDSHAGSTTIANRIDYFAKGLDAGRTAYPNLWFYEPYANAADSGKGDFQDDEGTNPTGYQWLHACTVGMYWYGSDHVDAIDTSYGVATAWATRDVGSWDSEPPYAEASQYTAPATGTAQPQIQGVRQRIYSDFIRMLTGQNWGHERLWPVDQDGLFPAANPADWHDVDTHTPTIEASYAFRIVDAYCKANDWAAVSTFVTSGQGLATHEVAQGASAHAAVAFVPSGTTNGSTARSLVVDTTIIAGTGNVRLRWYDPTTGTYSTIAASEAQNAARSVTLPAARGDGTRDFALVVDDWVEGTVAATLAPFTSSASGTVAAPSITGTVAVTLGSFTPSATGKQGETGTSARTLGSFTPTATGTSTPPGSSGTVASTLGSFTPAASGTSTPPAFTGTAAPTLGTFAPSATGKVGQVGTSGSTLGNFTPAASGTFAPSGSGFAAPALAAFTSTASGTVTLPPITGTVIVTLAPFTSSASGTTTPPSFTGTLARTLGTFTSTASGAVTAPGSAGSATPTLAPFVAAGTGSVGLPAITGTAAVTLGSFVSQSNPIVITGAFRLRRVDAERDLQPADGNRGLHRLDSPRTLENA